MSTPTAPTPLSHLVHRLEAFAPLDAPAKQIGRTVRQTIGPGTLKDALSGTWLGHALHPVLTDVVIGSWTSATLLDLFGGRSSEQAAERLLAIGMAAYGPTVLTGMTDWADTEIADDGVRRVGIVHAVANSVAMSLYTASLRSRRRGARGRGIGLALAGAGALVVGGHLGGHMAYAQGVGVDQTTFDPGPQDWTPVLDAAALTAGRPVTAVAGDTPVMLVRDGARIHAIHDRCSHRGCSLAEGEVEGGVVTCACHGSRFRLIDGEVERGPATTPQPAFETRERDGRVEVRRRPAPKTAA